MQSHIVFPLQFKVDRVQNKKRNTVHIKNHIRKWRIQSMFNLHHIAESLHTLLLLRIVENDVHQNKQLQCFCVILCRKSLD